MCNKKIYNKIKCYESKINKNFHDNKIPKEGSHCICLLSIFFDFVFKWTKAIIQRYFKKNANTLSKKKK